MSSDHGTLSPEILPPGVDSALPHSQGSRRLPALLKQVAVFGVCALLLFGPLAFGATEPWSLAVLQVGAALLFCLWAVRQVAAGRLKLRYNPLFPPMALFAVLVAGQLLFGATAYGYATLAEAGRFLAYGLLFFLIVHCFRSDGDLRVFALWFSAAGFLIAVFAIAQGFTDPSGKLYWVRAPRDLGWTYGPYVNHNHYAGLMEMLVPLPLLLALRGELVSGKRVILGLAALVMAASVFLSQSRGGMLALLAEFLLLAVLLWRRGGRRQLAAAIGLSLLLLALIAGLAGTELLQRLAGVDIDAETTGGNRLQIVRDALRMFAEKPVFGWGLGAFPDAFPRFRSFYSSNFVNHAHNDYVQALVETGLAGLALVLWFIVALYRAALRRLRARGHGISGVVTLAALLGCTGLLVHSFLDFNLHIPANAALFFSLCALATASRRTSGAPGRAHAASVEDGGAW